MPLLEAICPRSPEPPSMVSSLNEGLDVAQVSQAREISRSSTDLRPSTLLG